MEGAPRQSFSLNLRVMRICGLYPPENHTSSYKIYAYLMYFVSLIPTPSLALLHFIIEKDIESNLMQVSYNTGMVCYIFKLLPFINNGEKIKRCIHYFEEPKFALVENEHKKIIEECDKSCRRNSIMFLSAIALSYCNWILKPLFGSDYQLPVEVWLPFNPTATPSTYYCVYFFFSTVVGYAAFGNAALDPLIGGLACQATGQLKILKNNLQNLSEHGTDELIYKKIKEAIQRHNEILHFVDEYQECFSIAVFSQFMGSIFVICFCCLELSKLPLLSVEFLLMIMYFCITLGQIFFYCYYGTTLLEESNSLSNAVYMSKWYEYDVKSKKLLIVLMERSKRPMVVSAGKLLDLSLQTFTMVLRRSYSLLAVLKNY